MLIEYGWMPTIITTNFDFSLMSAIKREFLKAKLLGGYSHLLQAINKKLKKLNISPPNYSSND
ncbi:hypothetical protein HZS_4320 [Henneguya salminicola]|nr:hypothetical protein HZS_4320 [Henneguya salminicola]